MGVSAQPHATAALSPGKTLYMLYIGGWVDPRAGLGSSENLAPPHRDSIPGPFCP